MNSSFDIIPVGFSYNKGHRFVGLKKPHLVFSSTFICNECYCWINVPHIRDLAWINFVGSV